jgi:hypothetical protein
MTPHVENAFPAAAGPLPAAASEPAPALALAPAAAEHETAPPGDGDEAAAWAEVEAHWNDEARHRAYLARFSDLEGLAAAGGRYRAALAARPRDPVAARFRDEVVRRAIAHGLASLPRSAPEHARGKVALRVAAAVVIAGLLLAAAVMTSRLLPLLGARA